MGRRGKASAAVSSVTADISAPPPAAAVSRSQQKKAVRAQLAAAVNEKHRKLEGAEALEDVTEMIPASLKKFNKNGINATLHGCKAAAVPPTLLEASFSLCRENMKDLYDKTQFNDKGWEDKVKWRELTHDSARYLFATRADDGNLIGFAHFRFEMDEDSGEEIMYLYEVQLCNEARRKGVGRVMMTVLEVVARKLEMKKIVCTVLKDNVEAHCFFTSKLGYRLDPSSPQYVPSIHGQGESSHPHSSGSSGTGADDKPPSTELATIKCSSGGKGGEATEARRVLHQLMVDGGEDGDYDYDICEYEILSKVMKPLKATAPTTSDKGSSSSSSGGGNNAGGGGVQTSKGDDSGEAKGEDNEQIYAKGVVVPSGGVATPATEQTTTSAPASPSTS